ncbi:MAG: hypothetical protein ACLROH_02605 [Streptococcus sp.]
MKVNTNYYLNDELVDRTWSMKILKEKKDKIVVKGLGWLYQSDP